MNREDPDKIVENVSVTAEVVFTLGRFGEETLNEFITKILNGEISLCQYQPDKILRVTGFALKKAD